MRTVGFTVTEGGISPTKPLYAGVQGEHNATEVLFTLPDVWVRQGYAVRAEFVDGTGAFDTTGFLEVSGNLATVPLPAAWTAAGGMGEIRLAAARLDEMGLPEQQVIYSAVGYLYFDSREGGNAAECEVFEQGLSALIADTQRAAADANATAEELRRARDNGEFDGKTGPKGDTGAQGPKGEPGETGKPGESGRDGQAIMPVSYVHPRLSGKYGAPDYRYTYEIYTTWESLPDGFLFSVPLVYGLKSGDAWGIEIKGGSGWIATEDNFDGWNIDAGTHLFSFAGGKVTHIKGEKGAKGDTGATGLQGPKGDTGATGPQGPKGDTGATGSQGPKGDTGNNGRRGTGLLYITTAPSSYTTATGGFTPAYRIALSTVLTQSKASEVLVGDMLSYSYYHYPVGYVDSSYVYLGTRKSLRGTNGADGKSAYAYAQDGGYTGSETDFAEKLAQTALVGTTAEITPSQVIAALAAGGTVVLSHIDESVGEITFNNFVYVPALGEVVIASAVADTGDLIGLLQLTGSLAATAWSITMVPLVRLENLPRRLPNPYALKIGNESYDGQITVDITNAVNILIDAKLGVIENGSY